MNNLKVCIVRNAELESNAGMLRIIDALLEKNYPLLVISRSREVESKNRFLKRVIKYHNKEIPNYEIQVKGVFGNGLNNILNLIIYQFLLFCMLIKNRKDYNTIHSFDLDTGLISLISSYITKKKLVYHIADFYVDSRGGIPKLIRSIIRKIEHYVISKANVVVICAEHRREQIAGSKPKKVYVVHNVPVIIKDRKILSSSLPVHNSIRVGYVGALSRRRFIYEILEVASKNNNIKLNIAGYGQLSAVAEKYNHRFDNITYYGKVNYDKALSIYEASDLILIMYDPNIPNNKYSAPNKLYEAMALGKAVIVTRGTGIDDIVSQENIGLVVEPSYTDLEKAINFFIKNPTLLNQMQTNARNAYSKYSWDKMKRRIQEIYEKL